MIRRKIADLRRLRLPVWSAPLVLLAACLASYALLIPALGFYWDDWPIQWIAMRLGPEGLARYFATNRPFWGLLYQATTPLLGSTPWHWQVFGLLWRWISAVLLWGVLRLVWPRHPQPALWAGLLFTVYPGFGQQFISLVYSHFFIVLSAFLGSLGCTLLALRRRRAAAAWTVLGLALSLVNLITMEYFFLLEALRPALVWIALGELAPGRRERMRRTLRAWLPYLLLFLGAGIWRAFLFPYQTQNYQPKMLAQLQTSPAQTVWTLLTTILGDVWQTTFGMWGRVFTPPNPAVFGARSMLVYALLSAGLAALLAACLLLSEDHTAETARTNPQENGESRWRRLLRTRPGWALPCMTAGLIGLLTAGWPFWLTGIPVGLDFPNDRFTLSFMLGACLLLAGLWGWLPLPQRFKLAMLALALGLAGGLQFQNATTYRRDWEAQRVLFLQLTWRAPALQPGTTLLTNDLPVRYFSDNSLTAPLNWLYAPDNRSQQMSYILYFPSLRVGAGLPALQPGLPIYQNYLAASFTGSTSQMTALVFNPPACLRVLDPDLDPLNSMLPVVMREAARVSTRATILPAEGRVAALDPTVYGPAGQPGGWCYYFESADLAGQLGDWQAVVALGDEAFGLDDYPNDPAERLVFIEGYAHEGNWNRALELTAQTRAITPAMQPVLCRLWQRIAANTPAHPAQQDSVLQAKNGLECR